MLQDIPIYKRVPITFVKNAVRGRTAVRARCTCAASQILIEVLDTTPGERTIVQVDIVPTSRRIAVIIGRSPSRQNGM